MVGVTQPPKATRSRARCRAGAAGGRHRRSKGCGRCLPPARDFRRAARPRPASMDPFFGLDEQDCFLLDAAASISPSFVPPPQTCCTLGLVLLTPRPCAGRLGSTRFRCRAIWRTSWPGRALLHHPHRSHRNCSHRHSSSNNNNSSSSSTMHAQQSEHAVSCTPTPHITSHHTGGTGAG